jgi:hypothetical protein
VGTSTAVISDLLKRVQKSAGLTRCSPFVVYSSDRPALIWSMLGTDRIVARRERAPLFLRSMVTKVSVAEPVYAQRRHNTDWAPRSCQ